MGKLKEGIKQDLKERIYRRTEYLEPSTRFAKSDQVLKLICVGRTVGFPLPRDIVRGMNLTKGQLLKVTLELFPSDVVKLHE